MRDLGARGWPSIAVTRREALHSSCCWAALLAWEHFECQLYSALEGNMAGECLACKPNTICLRSDALWISACPWCIYSSSDTGSTEQGRSTVWTSVVVKWCMSVCKWDVKSSAPKVTTMKESNVLSAVVFCFVSFFSKNTISNGITARSIFASY